MNDLRTRLQGLWLPLVTPFRDGEIDSLSLQRLVRHYAAGPIDGLILAATSGEGLLLSSSELERLVDLVRTALDGAGRQLPICLGLAGASTARMCEAIDETVAWPIDGDHHGHEHGERDGDGHAKGYGHHEHGSIPGVRKS